jgi:hypothetical protein
MSVIGIIGKSKRSAKAINGEMCAECVLSVSYALKQRRESEPECNALHFWNEESPGWATFRAWRNAVSAHGIQMLFLGLRFRGAEEFRR